MQTITIIAIALFILVIIFARRVLIQENELFELRKAWSLQTQRVEELIQEKQKLKEIIEVQDGIINDEKEQIL